MITGLAFMVVGVLLIIIAAAGASAPDGDGAAAILAIPAIVFMLIGLLQFHGDLTERWTGWAECVDGETQVDDIIIADCDGYYNFPASDNGE